MDTNESNLTANELDLLFASGPDQDLILDTDLKIVSATRAYLIASGRRLEELKGRLVFEAFPENPLDPHGGLNTLRESLERVLTTKKSDRIESFRYDIPASDANGVTYLERYWSPINIPILDAAAEIKFILHRVLDVTASVHLKKQNARFVARLKDQDTEALLRIVANQLPAFVSYMGADRRYKFVNAFYAKWFDSPLSEIEGRKRSEITGKTTASVDLIAYEERAFRGERCSFELTLTRANGEYINLDTEYIPDVHPSSGEVIGIIGVGQDVTARKLAFQESQQARLQAKATEARFRNLSDSLPTLMWTWQADLGTTYINQGGKAYFGIDSVSQFSKAFISSLDGLDGISAQRAWYKGVATGQPFKVETQLRGPDGKSRWFLCQVTPIFNTNASIAYWITTATDIDDHRRTASELFVAKNAAENANRAKTEFLANMSHEIRTPLNSILGFSDLMKDESLPSAERHQFAATIARNGRLLTRIIDDILDLAKVESGRMEAEEVTFSLEDAISEVLALFADLAKQKFITLRSRFDDSVPKFIFSDPTRLRQILINVVGNAVKFTDKGHVTVELSARPDGERVEILILVRDTGRGITPSQRERLFQPFTQADTSTTRRYGGTGLGLALSRRLAETLSGSLELRESVEDEGSTFAIRIKVKPATAKAVTTALSETVKVERRDAGQKLLGLRVLIVDDSIDNQALVRHLLKKMGAAVLVASSGREGVATALTEKPDVVLMDIQMPHMDGYQALAALQAAQFKSPVLALTAHAMNEERAKTKAAGFAAHLTKPIDRAALESALQDFAGFSH